MQRVVIVRNVESMERFFKEQDGLGRKWNTGCSLLASSPTRQALRAVRETHTCVYFVLTVKGHEERLGLTWGTSEPRGNGYVITEYMPYVFETEDKPKIKTEGKKCNYLEKINKMN